MVIQFFYTVLLLGLFSASVNGSVESDVMGLFPTENQLLCDVLSVKADELSDGLINNPFKQCCVWELKHQIIEKVLKPSAHFVNDDDGDALLLQWFGAILLRCSNSEQAVEQWKKLSATKNIDLSQCAAKYQKYFLLDQSKIVELYTQAQDLLKSLQHTLCSSVQKKMNTMRIHDNYEAVSEVRRLSKVIENGLIITVLPQYIPELARQKKLSPDAPLLDRFKNKRILTVSGLENSKVSFMIHDLFDHAWSAHFLSQKKEFVQRYENFFKKVGKPFERDLYCRESELIASVAFEFRLYLASHDYVPLYDIAYIQNIFESSRMAGTMTNGQELASELLKDELQQSVDFFKSLPFIFSGVVVELMEQRRQYGFIRTHEEDGTAQFFQALDPEYAAFIVEFCALLWQNIDEVKKFLVNAALKCENYLDDQALMHDQTSLEVGIKEVESLDYSKLSLSDEKIRWFQENPGFAATRALLSFQEDQKKEIGMHTEYEVKFFVEPDSFKELLNQHGAILVKKDLLMRRKTFFLPGSDSQTQKNMWGRVRDEGDRITMTIKRISSGKSIDGVQEVEIQTNDFQTACSFMQIAGCIEKSYQENFRETWEFGDCQITIDRWPGLKPFVEIEGPDEQTVLNLLNLFNIDAESILFGSIDLLYEQYLGIPSAIFNQLPHVTFDSIDELIKQHARVS